MSRMKKLVIVILGGLGGVAILVAAGLVASHFVDLQPLRERVTQELSRRFGGTVTMQALHLSFVPLPHVTVDQVSVSVPGVVEGTIASLALYPKVLDLLRGRLQLAKLSLHTPDLTLHLPPPAAAEHPAAPPGPHALTPAALKETIGATVASISSTAVTQLPGLVLDLHDGTIRIATAGGAAFPFTNVEAAVDLPVGHLSLDLTCGSTLWEQLTLNASLDPHTLKGSAA